MTAPQSSPIDEVRAVLFSAERNDLDALKHEVAELKALRATVLEQEEELVALRAALAQQQNEIDGHTALLVETEGRMSAVSEVLVGAVENSPHQQGMLGEALRPEIEHAVGLSARQDSVILAEALYPVMGPAIRKMIAGLFTVDALTSRGGQPFSVDQALLIDRQSGLLLASSLSNAERADDADIVSGMLDAIRLFVQEAFDAQDHDGLRDLRVGDTSVLVEWGPKAVLASVVRGVPTDQYRQQAAETLETLHLTYGDRLEDFDGEIAGFQPAASELDRLRQRSAAALKAEARKSTLRRSAIGIAIIVLLVLLIIWIL